VKDSRISLFGFLPAFAKCCAFFGRCAVVMVDRDIQIVNWDEKQPAKLKCSNGCTSEKLK
jgi:hypothetical protein